MNASEYLSNLAAALNAARNADPLNIMSNICGVSKTVHISATQKSFIDLPEEFRRGVAEWFANGKLTCYRKTDVPYGERKNSKKKITTTYFNAERDGLTIQLGHKNERNYQPSWMESGVEAMLSSNHTGACQYDKCGIVNYILSLGKTFEDLGEKV